MYSALVALEVVGQLNKIAIDSKAIIKKHALEESEPTLNQLIRIAKDEGFKTKLKKLSLSNLSKYPLPSIAYLNENKFVTILKIDEEKKELLLFDKDKTNISNNKTFL